MDCFPAHAILAATTIEKVGYFLSGCPGNLPKHAPTLALMESTRKFRVKVGPTFLRPNLSDWKAKHFHQKENNGKKNTAVQASQNGAACSVAMAYEKEFLSLACHGLYVLCGVCPVTWGMHFISSCRSYIPVFKGSLVPEAISQDPSKSLFNETPWIAT